MLASKIYRPFRPKCSWSRKTKVESFNVIYICGFLVWYLNFINDKNSRWTCTHTSLMCQDFKNGQKCVRMHDYDSVTALIRLFAPPMDDVTGTSRLACGPLDWGDQLSLSSLQIYGVAVLIVCTEGQGKGCVKRLREKEWRINQTAWLFIPLKKTLLADSQYSQQH